MGTIFKFTDVSQEVVNCTENRFSVTRDDVVACCVYYIKLYFSAKYLF